MTTQSATDAYDAVLLNAGALLPRRDTLDQRIANDVRNRTGRIIDVQGGYPHGTPYAQTANAWPFLATGTPQVDTDHDGMPDEWERRAGLDVNNPNDGNEIQGADGYTNLERYLGWLVGEFGESLTTNKL